MIIYNKIISGMRDRAQISRVRRIAALLAVWRVIFYIYNA